MAKKKKGGTSKKAALQEQLAHAHEQLATKDAELKKMAEQLAATQLEAQQAQASAASDMRLEQTVQQLVKLHQDTSDSRADYENRVLKMELQNLTERHRMLGIEELLVQNHELREEVMRLQAEHMEMSKAMAEVGQQSRREVARVQLALEATAREVLSSARARIAAEVHSQLDSRLRTLVEDHGSLQGSMLALAKQASALDRQYRALEVDRRQLKIEAEVGQSMGELQSRQVVLLRSQVDRLAIALKMAQVKAEDQAARAAAAEQALAEAPKTPVVHRVSQLGIGPGSSLAEAAQQLDDLAVSLSTAQAACKQWRTRALLYEKACGELQAALTAHVLGAKASGTLLQPSHSSPDLKPIWSAAEGEKAAPIGHKSPLSPARSDPSGVLGNLSCLSSAGPTPEATLPLGMARPASAAPASGGAQRALATTVRPQTAFARGPRFTSILPHTLAHDRAVRPLSATSVSPLGPVALPPPAIPEAASEAETAQSADEPSGPATPTSPRTKVSRLGAQYVPAAMLGPPSTATTALQPRRLRPGSVRYFSCRAPPDPFLAMERTQSNPVAE